MEKYYFNYDYLIGVLFLFVFILLVTFKFKILNNKACKLTAVWFNVKIIVSGRGLWIVESPIHKVKKYMIEAFQLVWIIVFFTLFICFALFVFYLV